MVRAGTQGRSAAVRLSDFLKTPPGRPSPIYVLRGTDSYLMGEARRAVRSQTIGDADPGLAVTEFSGAEAVLADVLDALRTLPFLAPHRLVVVREAEEFLEKKLACDVKGRTQRCVRDALLEYLDKPSDTGSLCLEVASWNEQTNLAKRVAKVGVLVACEADAPARIPAWLQTEARKRYGKDLTYGAAQMLVEYLGTDFAALLNAIESLALYAGEAKSIDAPDVDALVARGHHERVWALCDAVAERNVARALELLDAFWTEGLVAAQIVGILRPTFRQLVRVKALAGRLGLDEAMARAAVAYPARDRVRRAVQAFSDDALAAAYQALVDADLEAKTTPNERLALERLIHRLASPEAARAAAGLPAT